MSALLVLLSTHKGAATLADTLSAMTQILPPAGGWRLIVIDNDGDASSAETLRRFSHRLPLTIIRETRRGKNRALNRALNLLGPAVRGAELVVFTDDDVLPDPDWLRALQHAARQTPQAEIFGGAVTPAFPGSQPAWLKHFADRGTLLFAATDAREGFCAPTDVFGPNMAVRGGVFARGLRFNEAIGPDGAASYAMGSESEFLNRLARHGARAYFVERAHVRHIVRPQQLDPEWAVARARRHGRGHAQLRLVEGGAAMRSKLALAAVRAAAGAPFRSPLRRRFELSWAAGVVAGLLDKPLPPPPTPAPEFTPADRAPEQALETR